MKILVTGGAGFIGSHIVDALVEQGIEVVVVDDLSTGSRINLNPNATFYPISILDRKLKYIFKIEHPDAVIHEAAQTSVSHSIKDPNMDARINIVGSLNLLTNCVEFKVSKVIYASSCAIYGNPQYIPLTEDHPLDAISPYGISKHTVERYLFHYHINFSLDYCALRYSNVYGPRQSVNGEAGVVAIFASQMLSNQQPQIYGNGDKTRSYTYVRDIVRANLLAINAGKCGVYNIGTTEETSDRGIFNLISRFCAYEDAPKYVDERPGEIRRMCLDSSKAERDLHWVPETTLEEGIAETVRYYSIGSKVKPAPQSLLSKI